MAERIGVGMIGAGFIKRTRSGKKIKRITEEEVECINGSKESLTNPNYHLLKEFISWQ